MQRKWWFVSAALLALLVLACGCDKKKSINAPLPTGGNIVINEFLASNGSYGQDECGSYSDWVELYNRSDHAIDIAGYYLTDDLTKPTKWQVPSGHSSQTTIASHGYLMIWCDGGLCTEGVLHTTFSLSAAGEQLGLYDPTGDPIEGLTFGPQTKDVSYGRTVDGGTTWAFLTPPTPGASNSGGGAHAGPVFSGVALNPTTPTAGNPVTVSATITDVASMVGAYLFYKVGSGSFTSVTMTSSGTTWSGAIPAQTNGTTVSYYLRAIDNADSVAFYPSGGAASPLSYTIGGSATPVLFINEFMASNTSGITDSLGGHPDWVEIYNPGAAPVDIGGMYITDNLSSPTKAQIPTGYASTVVPAHGYLVCYPDGNPTWGPLHFSFGLSKSGEQLGLYTTGGAVIDSLTFGAQTSDVSQARVPDGSSVWKFLTTPTPGATNGTIPR